MPTDPSTIHTKLRELIKDIRFGMLTSRDGNGALYAHPLTVQNRDIDEDATLYFFIAKSGEPHARLQADKAVNVSFADPGADSYVSLAGTAQFVDDTRRKEELWSPLAKAWFPGGPTDPDLVLLAVHIAQAEYWHVQESKMTQLFKMAKAAVTGERPTRLGQHEELRLS